MLSNKHTLLTEEREQVDHETKRAEQTHIYLQLTDLCSKINTHLSVFVILEAAEMTVLEK